MPKDFRVAIVNSAEALDTWEKVTALGRNEWICWVTSAKQQETRERRIKVGISKLSGGMRRPCCWAGCPHREKTGV